MRNTLKLIRNFFRHKAYKPGNILLLSRIFTTNGPIGSRKDSIGSAITWLCMAQDNSKCGGVSAGYSFRSGWLPAYPETTGYIIETFYDYAALIENDSYRTRARQMAEWLVSIQMKDGAFQGGQVGENSNSEPVVFNTGMIVFGLLRAFHEEQDEKYLQAARCAGDWLVNCQDEDGAWRRNTYKSRVHAYKTRVAWALLMLWQATSEESYRVAAEKNLDWCLSGQAENGFVEHMEFISGSPYIHTIAYTARGLLESGIILENNKYIEAAMKIAERIFNYYEINKELPGQFNSEWKPVGSYSCLTGCAQMSIIWQHIYCHTSDARYLNAALKMNDFLVKVQTNIPTIPKVHGAIMGSRPVWGDYLSYGFPNWAAKFFIEALLQEIDARKKVDISQ